jgi:hypothetical protein
MILRVKNRAQTLVDPEGVLHYQGVQGSITKWTLCELVSDIQLWESSELKLCQDTVTCLSCIALDTGEDDEPLE